ncbi:MAG: Coenzyme F420 hydrogenase/dehydrogenase, beta subunit C-terminal domain [Pseudomonadales bacterium]|nr:Coenzyme F420 hydrogenase/dehydrogenase, beta subunit C-terminal domain [Pseudomonadales bacterium]
MKSLHHNSFAIMMNEVVDAGRCCACASCVLVCPHNVIEYIDNIPKQIAKKDAPFDYCGISEGAGCDVCANVCPRLWPREEHLKDIVFKNDRPYEGVFGIYRHIFVAKTKRDEIKERAQDGGIVTALLAWALRKGKIDGSVVSAVGDNDNPCFPSPKVATTEKEILSSAGSWYTYCPNNLALKEVRERGLKKVAFVGVPCQITPLRKMENMDPSFLVGEKKRDKIIDKQRGFLRDMSARVEFNIGLFCTEVFLPELMTERIEKDMGIPLTEVSKFNVKGEVLIYKKDGDVSTIPLQEAASKYQRPECQHCSDFSAEMADISCGGIGTTNATVIIIRTKKGEEIWREFEADGNVDVQTIEENKLAWNVLHRLARKQKSRVPDASHRSGTEAGLPQYWPTEAAAIKSEEFKGSNMQKSEIISRLAVAYGDDSAFDDTVGYMAGQPIPGDPGNPEPGQKLKLPPPPKPKQGGASPLWIKSELEAELE